ncbi:hypothetical protein [Prevotella sp.]|jgi:hypothetical protein
MEGNKQYCIDLNAQDLLEKGLVDVREVLLNIAYLNSEKRGDSQILESDVEVALEKVLKTKDAISKENRIRKWLKIWALSGMLYSFIGVFVFVVQNMRFDPSKQLGLLIIGLGMTLSVFSIFALSMLNHSRWLYKLSTDETGIDQFQVVRKWNEIEQLLVSTMKIKSKNYQVLLSYLIGLCNERISTKELTELIVLRNRLVHENVTLPRDEILNALATENKIISILNDRVKYNKE